MQRVGGPGWTESTQVDHGHSANGQTHCTCAGVRADVKDAQRQEVSSGTRIREQEDVHEH